MQIYKRVQLKKRELLKIQHDCEDYIWAAVDPTKCVISFGDDYLSDLRDVLLVRRCLPENIFGIGFNMGTGEIDFIAQINRRNPSVGVSGELDGKDKDKIEKTMRYFFEKLPVYRDQDEEDERNTSIEFC